jgi:diguanylate cyclase (GGDEF)-like protein
MSDGGDFGVSKEAHESSSFEDMAQRIAFLEAENTELRTTMIDLEADQLTIAALANHVIERINMQKEQIRHLQRERNIDPKTGLLNMRGLEEAYESLLASKKRRKADVSLPDSIMFIDIDRFKSVNSELGHTGADALLAVLASTLKDRLRDDDIIGRFGGDEFVVILPHTEVENAADVADDLRTQAKTKLFEQLYVDASLSIGVDRIHPKRELGSAIEQANKAMFQAKQAGRDQVVVMPQ